MSIRSNAMTFDDLLDFQERMFSAYVRNAMIFATLPCYLAEETRRNRARRTK
jgi:hypothetical protein